MLGHVINTLLLVAAGISASAQPRGSANVLWTDPGDVARLDFTFGYGGTDGEPRPPFSFVKEDLGGTTPKVLVKDARGRTWSVKFGAEACPEVFCNRLVWACGYVVETEYYVAHGQLNGARKLKRAKNDVQKDGSFAGARFQLRSDSPKFLTDANWTWAENPFNGTPQLNGLKILMMLVSNWDAKDARDIDRTERTGSADSNLGIFQQTTRQRTRYLYFVDDWGASMGRWGHSPARDKWDCASYTEQAPELVRDVKNGVVEWGYTGKHDHDIKEGIRVEDVRWLMQYLGRVTDAQIRVGLTTAGATSAQVDCYAPAIRNRVQQLRKITSATAERR